MAKAKPAEVAPDVITPPAPSELDIAQSRIRELDSKITDLEAQLRTPCSLCGKQKLDSL